MSGKSHFVLLTCLVSYLCLAVTGCAMRSLWTAGNFSISREDTFREGTALEVPEETLTLPDSPITHMQEEEIALPEQEEMNNSGHLHPVNLPESDLSEADLGISGNTEIDITGPHTEHLQETETEDGSEEADENGQQEKLDAALQLCQEAQKQWEEGNPDGAMEILDSAYELLISVDPDNDAALLQQKDDIRFLISKRTVEIYASRQNVANGTHREIPLSMNEHVKREIDSFLGAERDQFRQSVSRAGLYLPMIIKELSEAGLPTRLSWLPLIESYFKERAFSRARALGLWQFIPSTGYKFGLKRDKWIDERMDPIKSTRAAIEYLRQLHQIFGDWTTVLAAYNCGEGTVLRVIRKQHINYLDNFWDLYQLLPQETARYVPRFLAAIQIIEDPNRFGIEFDQPLSPLKYEEVTINKRVPLKAIADKLQIDEKALVDLNTELRYQVTPNYEYSLKVPPDTGEQILACLESISELSSPSGSESRQSRIRRRSRNVSRQSAEPAHKPDYITVRLKRGDTIHHLAQEYGVTVSSILNANKIKSTKRLQVGQRIRIPLNGDRATRSKKSMASSKGQKPAFTRYQVYYVKKGDSPAKIARNHNLGVDEFLKLNRLTSKSTLYPGQRVLVKID
ncbi:MAG: LysM peptidoglycan-binding domain-containing protein [bacterium]